MNPYHLTSAAMAHVCFKISARFFFGILFITLLPAEGSAQGFTSPISWHHSIYDARVSALGQSSASLYNGSSYHINPAIPLENGVLGASSFLFSTTAFESSVVPEGADLYSPAVSYANRRFSYSVLMDHTSYTMTNEPGIDGEKYSNTLFRFQTGYRITENFSAGAGFLYSSYKSPVSEEGNFGGDARAWGITMGAYYRNEFQSEAFHFNPQIGLSLNDLSNGFDIEDSWKNLPGQIRFGFGLDISTKQLQYNRPLFGVGIYTGFSKYLARWEIDDETSELNSPGGFRALFTTWNSFERFDGTEMITITSGEQISTSFGVELALLETLYFRYGIVGGSDYWIRPQGGIGAEIDLYYISLAVTRLNYHSSEGWLPQDSSALVQASFRIPIDGRPRDTLLQRLFNR